MLSKPKPVEKRKNGKEQTATNPRASGRPTNYRPEICDQLMELMAVQGYSMTAAAFQIGVSPRRLLEWTNAHPELAEAMELARAGRTAFHERRLMMAFDGPSVTSAIFTLKNAAPHEWRDRHELTGADGGAIKVEHSMDPLEVARRMAFMLAQGQQALAAQAGQVIEHAPLKETDAA